MEILLSDGADTASWTTDAGTLEAGRPQHVGVVVDGAANVITWVVDGELLDGGSQRDFGWTFFSGNVGDVNGADRMTLANGLDGTLQRFRLYDRYLMTTELIGNYRAGPSAVPEPSTVILVLITLIVAAGARGRACGGRRR
jgi:hypothetical protein